MRCARGKRIAETIERDLDSGNCRRRRHRRKGIALRHCVDHRDPRKALFGKTEPVPEKDEEEDETQHIKGDRQKAAHARRHADKQKFDADMFAMNDAAGNRQQGHPDHQIARQFFGKGQGQRNEIA
nr:hypothetical protein [Marinicella sp. W31]MDC2878203.1 hypothetical protein [Marinicella sp. W31]